MTQIEEIAEQTALMRNESRSLIQDLIPEATEENPEKIDLLLDTMVIRETLDTLDASIFAFLSTSKVYKLSPQYPVSLENSLISPLKDLKEKITGHMYDLLLAGETYENELTQTVAMSQEIDNLFLKLFNARKMPAPESNPYPLSDLLEGDENGNQ